MTLVVIGPVTEDLIVIGNKRSCKVGGATYFQSFVFDEFYSDYLAVVNCSDKKLAGKFPDADKVEIILKDDTHFFENNYPDKDNLNVRHQSSNFSRIPIYPDDLKDILPDEIDGFVLNPLNRYDFPFETVEYLKTFGVSIFMSLQGFLRVRGVKVNENYTIKLDNFDELGAILKGVTAIFMDEAEANIIGLDYDVDEFVITDASRGSRIIDDGETRIDAVKCDNVVDTTGCGDTYMAAYISQRLKGYNQKDSGNFASLIASKKIENSGPFKANK